jgi:hypothetical protein
MTPLVWAGAAHAQGVTTDADGNSRVSNWQAQARANLEIRERGSAVRAVRAVDLATRRVGRCIYINNYWCTKQPVGYEVAKLSSMWEGSIRPYVDKNEHAIFKDGVSGARAAVRNVRSKYFNRATPVRTLIGLYCSQAPGSDCIGSLRNANGTCTIGPNTCRTNAEAMARNLGVSADKPLPFFIGSNEYTARASVWVRRYLHQLSRDEISAPGGPRLYAKRQTIEVGIEEERRAKLRDLNKPKKPTS